MYSYTSSVYVLICLETGLSPSMWLYASANSESLILILTWHITKPHQPICDVTHPCFIILPVKSRSQVKDISSRAATLLSVTQIHSGDRRGGGGGSEVGSWSMRSVNPHSNIPISYHKHFVEVEQHCLVSAVNKSRSLGVFTARPVWKQERKSKLACACTPFPDWWGLVSPASAQAWRLSTGTLPLVPSSSTFDSQLQAFHFQDSFQRLVHTPHTPLVGFLEVARTKTSLFWQENCILHLKLEWDVLTRP